MVMMPQGGFNANDVPDDVWPAGDYLTEIVSSELKETKAGTGEYLKLGFKCMEGAQKGMMLFENLNLKNPNPVAVQIATKTLAKICKAVGKPNITDSNELHAIPLIISVIERPMDDPYPGNDIKRFKSAEGKGTASPQVNPFNR